MGFSPDGLRFTPSAANPILDPNDSVEQENHFLMLAPRGGRWLMPYEYGWYCPNGLGNFGQYMADVRLAVSEDGERFRRLNPHQKLIDRGAPGQWDDTILVVADKPVIASDTVHLFYAGAGAQWTCWASNNQPESLAHNVGANCVGRMGLATLRRDGWTCLETADGASFGSATSKEIEASERGSALKLNLSRAMPQRSFVTVEVIDAATGQVIKGLDRASCRPLDRDDLDATVTWRGRSLADAPARPIRLRFHFCGAVRLHAFAIEQ
ncbi:MAG: hypothetical protein CMJ18_26170 [Phycisphaeraceae bacterium]|nr:hypothetical protein [Phycisphaeraceae bacterium]